MSLRSARLAKALSQVQAARRLEISQSYLAMLEAGSRRVTPQLAGRLMKLYDLPASVLPPSDLRAPLQRKDSEGAPARALAALGYPGFAHLRTRNRGPKNPSEVLLNALAQENLEGRVVEALPWLVLKYWPMDREWLVRQAKIHDLQNRLGFVVTLARHLAERGGDESKARPLHELELDLERSRLAREDTLGRASLSEAERRWLSDHLSADARRWNILTDWTADALRYAP